MLTQVELAQIADFMLEVVECDADSDGPIVHPQGCGRGPVDGCKAALNETDGSAVQDLVNWHYASVPHR